MFPLAVTVRNASAGSFSLRYGLPEGFRLKNPVVEFNLRNEELVCPFIAESAISAIGIASVEEIRTITEYALRINEMML